MRKYVILFSSAATLVITGAATKAAYFSGHPAQVSDAATTIEPLSMHYGTLPAQNFSDRTLVFDQ